ncbi:hypothetical protein SSS_00472 [Sarcoptes scabiei]|uniref:Uncharacterized protein n=1 Tax=Sarcoptes scabiei TaxID=52283 RepID=A0A834R681_SARSC|nr:hypothetical protein SSS_00472 [Sarcoptes scabiei]
MMKIFFQSKNNSHSHINDNYRHPQLQQRQQTRLNRFRSMKRIKMLATRERLRSNPFLFSVQHYPMLLLVAIFLILFNNSPLVDAIFPVSLYITKSAGGQKCCSYGGGYGGGTMETFDDGTPLDFYRQQVKKIYGTSGGYDNNGYDMGYGGGGGGGGGGGRSYKPKYRLPSYQQLFKNSFRYPNIIMGGGFMKGDVFGPQGRHTSRKWRGYGRKLVAAIKQYGGGGGYGANDKLTFVQVVPSGASDEYKDSYVTLIADPTKIIAMAQSYNNNNNNNNNNYQFENLNYNNNGGGHQNGDINLYMQQNGQYANNNQFHNAPQMPAYAASNQFEFPILQQQFFQPQNLPKQLEPQLPHPQAFQIIEQSDFRNY